MNPELVSFGDMAHNVTQRVSPRSAEGLRYVGLEHLDPDSLRIRRWGTPGDVASPKPRFCAGDILFARRRSYQRKVALADFDGICSTHALVLRAREAVVAPEFLPFFMQSEPFHQRAMVISVGSLSPTINWATLARQEFALPPLDEQRRIAAILWAIEEACESYLRARRDLEQFKKALWTSELSNTEWPKVLLSQIANIGAATATRAASGAMSHKVVKEGSMLIALYGDNDLRGTATLHIEPGPGRPLEVIEPDPTRVDSTYLFHLLDQSSGDLLIGNAFGHLPIVLPPLERQREVAARLNEVDDQLNEFTDRLSYMSELKTESLKRYL